MLNLATIDTIIRTSPFFKRNFPGVIHGIHKSYFPKFEGFDGNPRTPEELSALAVEFYKTFYWYKLKLDLIDSPKVATLILYFSVLEGSKKALQKVNKTIGMIYGSSSYQGFSNELIDKLNSSEEVYQILLLEMLEFYSYTKKLPESEWLFSVYRLK